MLWFVSFCSERRILSFFQSLKNFDLHYRDLYSRLISASDFVRDFLPRGIPIPSSLDLVGVPLADILLPEVFEIPHFYADLPDLTSVRESIRRLCTWPLGRTL